MSTGNHRVENKILPLTLRGKNSSSARNPSAGKRVTAITTLIQATADQCKAMIALLKLRHHSMRSIIPSVGDEGSPL